MLITCPHCRIEFHSFDAAAESSCPHCHQLLKQRREETTDGLGTLSKDAPKTPWWNIRELLHYCGEITLYPHLFFKQLATQQVRRPWIIWAILASAVGSIGSHLWTPVIARFLMSQDHAYSETIFFKMLTEIFTNITEHESLTSMWAVWTGLSLLSLPFWVLIAIYIRSIVLTLGLWIVGDGRKSLWATNLQISIHAQTPSYLFAIPFLGSFISGISQWIVCVTGLSHLYRISTGRAVLVTLAPLLIVMVMLLIGLVMTAIFASSFLQMVLHLLTQPST